MADRQTKNVSLTPRQDHFIHMMVAAGRFRTASEVIREGLRLLEETEHRRLLEKWIYDGLNESEDAQLPPTLLKKARAQLDAWIEDGVQSGELDGWIDDGDLATGAFRELAVDRYYWVVAE